MTRRTFLVLVRARRLLALDPGRIGAVPREARHGRQPERHRLPDRLPGDPRRRQRRRCGGRHGIRAGGDASDSRQHRRRRLPGLPPGIGRSDDVRFPRSGAGRLESRDVAGRRQVRLAAASQQPPRGRRARHGRRLPSGVEDARQQAVEGPGDAGGQAGARRLRDQRRRWRDRSSGRSTTSRNTRRRSRSSPRTACRIRPARSSSSPTSRARSSGLPIRARRASTRAKRRCSSRKR